VDIDGATPSMERIFTFLFVATPPSVVAPRPCLSRVTPSSSFATFT